MLSSLAIQLAAATSKGLFATLGVIGTVFICKAISTALLWWQHPPSLSQHRPRDYGWVAALAIALTPHPPSSPSRCAAPPNFCQESMVQAGALLGRRLGL